MVGGGVGGGGDVDLGDAAGQPQVGQVLGHSGEEAFGGGQACDELAAADHGAPARETAPMREAFAPAPTPRSAEPAPLVPTMADRMLNPAMPPARALSPLPHSSEAMMPLPALSRVLVRAPSLSF